MERTGQETPSKRKVCKHQESSAKCRRDCASWRCLLTTASGSARYLVVEAQYELRGASTERSLFSSCPGSMALVPFHGKHIGSSDSGIVEQAFGCCRQNHYQECYRTLVSGTKTSHRSLLWRCPRPTSSKPAQLQALSHDCDRKGSQVTRRGATSGCVSNPRPELSATQRLRRVRSRGVSPTTVRPKNQAGSWSHRFRLSSLALAGKCWFGDLSVLASRGTIWQRQRGGSQT